MAKIPEIIFTIGSKPATEEEVIKHLNAKDKQLRKKKGKQDTKMIKKT